MFYLPCCCRANAVDGLEQSLQQALVEFFGATGDGSNFIKFKSDVYQLGKVVLRAPTAQRAGALRRITMRDNPIDLAKRKTQLLLPAVAGYRWSRKTGGNRSSLRG